MGRLSNTGYQKGKNRRELELFRDREAYKLLGIIGSLVRNTVFL